MSSVLHFNTKTSLFILFWQLLISCYGNTIVGTLIVINPMIILSWVHENILLCQLPELYSFEICFRVKRPSSHFCQSFEFKTESKSIYSHNEETCDSPLHSLMNEFAIASIFGDVNLTLQLILCQ